MTELGKFLSKGRGARDTPAMAPLKETEWQMVCYSRQQLQQALEDLRNREL